MPRRKLLPKMTAYCWNSRYGEFFAAFLRLIGRVEFPQQQLVVRNDSGRYSGRSTASLIKVGRIVGQKIKP